MTPELNREYPELDDPKVFEQMVNLTVGQMKPIRGHLRRGQHAKATGCVIAEFRIADDIPSDLQHGIFANLVVPSALSSGSRTRREPLKRTAQERRGAWLSSFWMSSVRGPWRMMATAPGLRDD